MIDYDGLNRLAYQIKTETGRAANTALRVGTLFEDIIDALKEGDNTGLLDQITNLKNDISKIINMIKDLNTEIDTSIITRIEANERNISNINNTIQGINTTISSIQGDINTINSTLSNHTTLIDGLQGQITTINNSITEIGTQISNITNTISTITSDLTALTTRVSTNETNIAELKKRLDAIDLDPIIAAINKLNVDLTALTSRVSSAELEINALNEFTSALSRQITEEIDRATAAEEALDAKFNDYLPLAGGTMKGYIRFDGFLNGSMPIIDTSGESNIMGCMGMSLNGATPKIFLRSSYNNIYLGFSDATNLRVERNAIYREASDHSLYTIWDKGNDGSGSGLDADLLDGHHWTDFALKSDVPDMSDVFYKSKGGTVGARTTFQEATFLEDSLVINKGLILFGNTAKESKVEILRLGAYPYLSIYPEVKVEFGYVTHNMTLQSNSPIVRQNTSALYKLLDESNSVYVVSSYPTDLSSYPDGAIFIKTS